MGLSAVMVSSDSGCYGEQYGPGERKMSLNGFIALGCLTNHNKSLIILRFLENLLLLLLLLVFLMNLILTFAAVRDPLSMFYNLGVLSWLFCKIL